MTEEEFTETVQRIAREAAQFDISGDTWVARRGAAKAAVSNVETAMSLIHAALSNVEAAGIHHKSRPLIVDSLYSVYEGLRALVKPITEAADSI